MDFSVERTAEDWPSVMIVMPAKNDAEWLPACLAALLRMDYPHRKLRFVFGYGQSTDETRRIIEKILSASDIAYEVMDEPETGRPVKSALYLADTMNLLQSQLRDEDYILYADADVVEVPENILKELIRAEKDIVAPCPMMESEPGRFVFYDTYVFRDLQGRNFTRVQKSPDHPWLKGVRPVEMMSIGTMGLVRRNVAQEVRWDNPVPWLQYCLNARKKGFRVWALPFVRVHHAAVPSELHVRVEDFVRRGVVPSSELKKVQTLNGWSWLQERFCSFGAFGIARFVADIGLRFAPRPTAFLIRKLFPPTGKRVQQFLDIARESKRVRTAQDT
jgi:glycosyltransferase involved in cell wall biosynthesis